MWSDLLPSIFPASASTFADQVDHLYAFLVALTAFFTIGISAAALYLAVRYRRRSPDEVGHPIHGSMALEVSWSIIPLLIMLVIFGWSAALFMTISRAPSDAIEVTAIGKRWMWKFQHPSGQREINELHVPIGQPVRVLIGSEDVLHSLYIPAFRVKMDAVPGKFTSLWFEATEPGRYHLFCAEFCGTNHSGMIGSVVVMTQGDYQAWLAGGLTQGPPEIAGRQLFEELACNTCHFEQDAGRGPSLVGMFGSEIRLEGGQTVTANEAYVRESIMNSQAQVVEGYAPLMPSFQGLISEEGLLQLVAYIRSLDGAAESTTAGAAP